jgi:hypothetical protein
MTARPMRPTSAEDAGAWSGMRGVSGGEGMGSCECGGTAARTQPTAPSDRPEPEDDWSGTSGPTSYWQPDAKALTKQLKSSTFSTGAWVDPSQLARGSPRLNWLRKQLKSKTLREGGVVEASQLA